MLQEAYARHRDGAPSPTCCCPRPPGARRTGTVTNSERRISRVRAAVPAPGEARHDWEIAVRFRASARGAPAARRADALSTFESAEVALERASRDDARARPRHHRPVVRRCSSATDRSSGRIPKGATRGHGAALRRTACSPRRAARRASSPAPTGRSPRRPMRRYPAAAHHRATARPVARHEPHRQRAASSSATSPEPRLGDAPRGPGAPRARRWRPGARRVAARRDLT